MHASKGLKKVPAECAELQAGYEKLDEEVILLDEFLKVRTVLGMTQAEVARRIGTTQSAIARLESGGGRHSPSLATLRKYAHALGCRLELKLVCEGGSHSSSMSESLTKR